jgi:hypothetical protein
MPTGIHCHPGNHCSILSQQLWWRFHKPEVAAIHCKPEPFANVSMGKKSNGGDSKHDSKKKRKHAEMHAEAEADEGCASEAHVCWCRAV